ncbi:hypothetical protein EDD86DRAFT_185713 [Gorgonomyces haynaldii]|nr:hypothetical protein EDD86DRAFT_185713 [Gorgonomyces haynaldii]
MDPSLEQAVNLANKEFIKGFISGQLLLCTLIFFLVKMFLLRNSAETRLEILAKRRFFPKVVAKQQRRTLDTLILGKLNYEQKTESCEWLNVLLAQILVGYRQDQEFLQILTTLIDNAVNADRPGFIGRIHLTELLLGEEFPFLSNCRIKFDERMMVLVDFSFNDQISLGIDTQMLVNWPREGMASLPISLGFQLTRFSGTLAVEFLGDQFTSAIGISVMDDIILEFQIKSLLGHRTKVKDLPKLTELVTMRLKQAFVDHLVYPRKMNILIPKPKPTQEE